MTGTEFKHRLPGYIATGLVILTTSFWTFWGAGEMYYEGWWGAWYNRLPYLVPAAVCLAFTLMALTWPRFGGWLIILMGGAFTAWRWWRQVYLGGLTLSWMLGWFPISGLLVVTGVLFIFEGGYRRQRGVQGWAPPESWLRRNRRYIVALTPPLLVFISVTALFAPLLLTRVDDGGRGMRLIKGNGVTLAWAPAGPGWSEGIGPSRVAGRLLPGANLSWNDIALYGVPPVGFGDKVGYEERDATAEDMEVTGLCRYLSEDGTTLMTDPQNIWRMPTTDEIVRALVRGGENAGCTWDGESANADCRKQPNKDTPLWAPDESPIYYWSADEYDEESAWYVPYTGGGRYGGMIGYQSKNWGNPRHGYRCVHEP